jgi:hypothetical protein
MKSIELPSFTNELVAFGYPRGSKRLCSIPEANSTQLPLSSFNYRWCYREGLLGGLMVPDFMFAQ